MTPPSRPPHNGPYEYVTEVPCQTTKSSIDRPAVKPQTCTSVPAVAGQPSTGLQHPECIGCQRLCGAADRHGPERTRNIGVTVAADVDVVVHVLGYGPDK